MPDTNPIKIVKALPSEAGCWIDGHWGHYGSPRLIEIAAVYGYPNQDDIALAKLYNQDSTYPDCEFIHDAADNAELWMNDNIAPEGYSFGWLNGEFFLWSTKTWEENSY